MVRTDDMTGESAVIQAAEISKLRWFHDEYLLIILDACRFDALEQYLSKTDIDVHPALSPAPHTAQWFKSVWPDEYDITYVSASPQITAVDFIPDRVSPQEGALGYDGDEQFSRVIHTWDHGWDDELGTTHPSTVTDDVLGLDPDENARIVAHFKQPHAPFIGDTDLGLDEISDFGSWGSISKADQEYLNQIDISDLHQAYMENLDIVWREGVQPLLDEFNDRLVIVSADHGEALGENGVYGHGAVVWDVLIVPWVDFVPPED